MLRRNSVDRSARNWLILFPFSFRASGLRPGRGDESRENVDNSYVSRMVNLTTLAPDIVAAILDADLPDQITLFDLAVDPPALWEDQRTRIG